MAERPIKYRVVVDTSAFEEAMCKIRHAAGRGKAPIQRSVDWLWVAVAINSISILMLAIALIAVAVRA